MKYYDKVKQVTEATVEAAKKAVKSKLPVRNANEEKGIIPVNENSGKIKKGNKLSQAHEIMMKTLNWAYDYAVSDNVPGVSSISKLAEEFLKKSDTVTEACNKMIRWQLAYAGSMGFVTNLGGMITLPVSIPSNIASVLYIQIRMVAAIAYIGGYDLKSEQVRTSVFLSLLGGSANMVLDSVAIHLTSKLTVSAINQISEKTLTKINQAVGFSLLTKFGSTGVLNMDKTVPVVGGLVGGTLDVLATNVIANAAKNMFLKDTMETERLDKYETIRIKALINMAKVDNHFPVEEREMVEEVIRNSTIPENEKQNLRDLMDKRELINIDFSLFKKNDLYGFSLLNSLVSIMLADGKIQPAETLYLKKVAKEIGVATNVITEILDSYQANL